MARTHTHTHERARDNTKVSILFGKCWAGLSRHRRYNICTRTTIVGSENVSALYKNTWHPCKLIQSGCICVWGFHMCLCECLCLTQIYIIKHKQRGKGNFGVDISQRESKNTYIDCVCVCVCVCRRITGSLWHSNMSDINAITIWNGSTERNMNLCCKWTLKLYMYVFIAIRVCQLKGFIGLI